MLKSLSESAAEILATSLGAKKDAMPVGGAPVDDLGGSDEKTKPEGDAIGVTAAAKAKEAPKPGTAGAPAEGKKKQEESVESDEDLPELTEEEIDAYLDSLTEEELAELAALSEEEEDETTGETTEVVAEETTDEVVAEETAPELTEEEVAAARSAALKSMVAENMGSCKQDIDALFSGESLSEEFQTKATTIFEAAVRARVEAIVEKVAAENEAIMESTVVELEEQMTAQVDEYLNYVVEQWMEENKLAVETGLRTEIAEDFMAGLKNLFTEHYIEVPEEKTDLLEELAAQVAAKEEALAEQAAKNAELTKALNESKAVEVLRKTCEGLTEVQVAKIKSLAEGVEFTTEGEYLTKLAVIRENYFPTGKKVSEAPKTLVETSDPAEVSDSMARYVSTISKTLPKV